MERPRSTYRSDMEPRPQHLAQRPTGFSGRGGAAPEPTRNPLMRAATFNAGHGGPHSPVRPQLRPHPSLGSSGAAYAPPPPPLPAANIFARSASLRDPRWHTDDAPDEYEDYEYDEGPAPDARGYAHDMLMMEEQRSAGYGALGAQTLGLPMPRGGYERPMAGHALMAERSLSMEEMQSGSEGYEESVPDSSPELVRHGGAGGRVATGNNPLMRAASMTQAQSQQWGRPSQTGQQARGSLTGSGYAAAPGQAQEAQQVRHSPLDVLEALSQADALLRAGELASAGPVTSRGTLPHRAASARAALGLGGDYGDVDAAESPTEQEPWPGAVSRDGSRLGGASRGSHPEGAGIEEHRPARGPGRAASASAALGARVAASAGWREPAGLAAPGRAAGFVGSGADVWRRVEDGDEARSVDWEGDDGDGGWRSTPSGEGDDGWGGAPPPLEHAGTGRDGSGSGAGSEEDRWGSRGGSGAEGGRGAGLAGASMGITRLRVAEEARLQGPNQSAAPSRASAASENESYYISGELSGGSGADARGSGGSVAEGSVGLSRSTGRLLEEAVAETDALLQAMGELSGVGEGRARVAREAGGAPSSARGVGSPDPANGEGDQSASGEASVSVSGEHDRDASRDVAERVTGPGGHSEESRGDGDESRGSRSSEGPFGSSEGVEEVPSGVAGDATGVRESAEESRDGVASPAAEDSARAMTEALWAQFEGRILVEGARGADKAQSRGGSDAGSGSADEASAEEEEEVELESGLEGRTSERGGPDALSLNLSSSSGHDSGGRPGEPVRPSPAPPPRATDSAARLASESGSAVFDRSQRDVARAPSPSWHSQSSIPTRSPPPRPAPAPASLQAPKPARRLSHSGSGTQAAESPGSSNESFGEERSAGRRSGGARARARADADTAAASRAKERAARQQFTAARVWRDDRGVACRDVAAQVGGALERGTQVDFDERYGVLWDASQLPPSQQTLLKPPLRFLAHLDPRVTTAWKAGPGQPQSMMNAAPPASVAPAWGFVPGMPVWGTRTVASGTHEGEPLGRVLAESGPSVGSGHARQGAGQDEGAGEGSGRRGSAPGTPLGSFRRPQPVRSKSMTPEFMGAGRSRLSEGADRGHRGMRPPTPPRAVSATAGGGRPSTPGDMGGVSEVVESVLSDVSEVMEEGEEGAEVAIVTAMDSGIDIEEHSTPLFRGPRRFQAQPAVAVESTMGSYAEESFESFSQADSHRAAHASAAQRGPALRKAASHGAVQAPAPRQAPSEAQAEAQADAEAPRTPPAPGLGGSGRSLSSAADALGVEAAMEGARRPGVASAGVQVVYVPVPWPVQAAGLQGTTQPPGGGVPWATRVPGAWEGGAVYGNADHGWAQGAWQGAAPGWAAGHAAHAPGAGGPTASHPWVPHPSDPGAGVRHVPENDVLEDMGVRRGAGAESVKGGAGAGSHPDWVIRRGVQRIREQLESLRRWEAGGQGGGGCLLVVGGVAGQARGGEEGMGDMTKATDGAAGATEAVAADAGPAMRDTGDGGREWAALGMAKAHASLEETMRFIRATLPYPEVR